MYTGPCLSAHGGHLGQDVDLFLVAVRPPWTHTGLQASTVRPSRSAEGAWRSTKKVAEWTTSRLPTHDRHLVEDDLMALLFTIHLSLAAAEFALRPHGEWCYDRRQSGHNTDIQPRETGRYGRSPSLVRQKCTGPCPSVTDRCMGRLGRTPTPRSKCESHHSRRPVTHWTHTGRSPATVTSHDCSATCVTRKLWK